MSEEQNAADAVLLRAAAGKIDAACDLLRQAQAALKDTRGYRDMHPSPRLLHLDVGQRNLMGLPYIAQATRRAAEALERPAGAPDAEESP